MTRAARARLLIATLWAGSLWTAGYVVAPTLFATLPERVLAGTIAGSIFRVEAWLSLVCGMALVLLARQSPVGADRGQRRILLRLIAGMLLCTLIGYFGLQPWMADLRAAAGANGVMTPDARMQFGLLHALASAIYLFESLLGVALIFKIR